MSVVNTQKFLDTLSLSFSPKNNPSNFVLITGTSGSGKTGFCVRVVALAKEAGLSVGGILCPAIFQKGKKTGIDQLDIRTGKKQRLGVLSNDIENSTIGRWRMDESVIALGNQIIAGLKDEDVIIIDELGPLELKDGCGYRQALQLLDEGHYKTIFVVVRSALLPVAQLRWPQAQICFLESMAQ